MTRRATAAEKARGAFLREVGICAVTGIEGDIQVAHIRGADALFCKPLTGMAIKPHWVWTLPLSAEAHREQHEIGEGMFWNTRGYPWRDITRGPMAAALVLEGFRAMDDAEGARTWLRERANKTVHDRWKRWTEFRVL